MGANFGMNKLSHKRSIFIFAVLFWATFSQFSLHLFSQTQEKPLRYKVEVVLIEIPLYMIDKEGNPIKNLKPEEVILYENGIRQEITHFIMVQNDSPEIASVVRKYPVARRQFLLLIDFAFATAGRIVKARRACMDFIKEKILPNDLVAVATYSAMGGLEVHSHFTNDRDHLFSVIDTLGLVEMPRMHGYELIAEIRRNEAMNEIPIIVLTSRAVDKHYKKTVELGADDYIVKPVDEDTLLQSVKKLLVR